MIRSSLGGGGGLENSCEDSGASDTASDRPESLLDGMMKSSVNSDPDGIQRHSPAGSASSNPLFPPGLEALYRQAGFPSAFLGLAAGTAGAGATPPGVSGATSIPGLSTSVPQVGLQSHAGNPNREF